MPAVRASSMARLDGADTAPTSGMPARNAFCTISKRRSPADKQERLLQRQAAAEEHPPDQLVDRIVPSDIFGAQLELSRAVE